MKTFFALLLFSVSIAVVAQQPVKVYRIGVVLNSGLLSDWVSPETTNPRARAFREGLRERGWIEGRNIEILWRSAEDKYERRPALIKELVRLPVDVILVVGNFATEEAIGLTRNIPIVMLTSYAPVDNKLVASIARPGGNVTGLTADVGRELQGKRLALLKQAAPSVSRVAFLVPSYGKPETSLDFAPETFAAARALGLSMFHVRFDTPDQLEQAIDDAIRQGANGLFLGEWAPFVEKANQVAAHKAAARHRVPAIHCVFGSAESGGLMEYGPEIVGNYRRAGYYVDKILTGARPGDLPIEQPSKFQLTVNLKAAKAIGLTFPPSVLAQADRVIE